MKKTKQVIKSWETKHKKMFPPSFKAKFLEMHKAQGMTLKEISKKLNMHPSTLRQWTIREAIDVSLFQTAKKKKLENNKLKIFKMYKESNSLADIAKEYQVSVQMVSRFLKFYKIKLRTVSEANLNNPKIKGVKKDVKFQRDQVMKMFKKFSNFGYHIIPTAGLGIGYIPDLVIFDRNKIIAVEFGNRISSSFMFNKIRTAKNLGYDFILFIHQVNYKMKYYDMTSKDFVKIPSKLNKFLQKLE